MYVTQCTQTYTSQRDTCRVFYIHFLHWGRCRPSSLSIPCLLFHRQVPCFLSAPQVLQAPAENEGKVKFNSLEKCQELTCTRYLVSNRHRQHKIILKIRPPEPLWPGDTRLDKKCITIFAGSRNEAAWLLAHNNNNNNNNNNNGRHSNISTE